MTNLPTTAQTSKGPRVLILVPHHAPRLDWADGVHGFVLADPLSGDDPHNPRIKAVTDGEFLDLALSRIPRSSSNYEAQFEHLDPMDETDMKLYASLVLNGTASIRVAGMGWVYLQLVKEDWR